VAAEVELDRASLVAGGEETAKLLQNVGGQVDIDDTASGIVVKMSMILEVGAVPRGAAFEINLLDQPAADQGVEAVINRGQRDGRHEDFHARKNLVD